MRRHILGWMIFLLLLIAGSSGAQPMEERGSRKPVRLMGEPVNAGFVLVDGRYLDRPYRVSVDDEAVQVNGVALPQLRTWRSRRGEGRRGGQRGSPRELSPTHLAAMIERRLNDGGMVFVHGENFGQVLSGYESVAAITTLHTDGPIDQRIERLQSLVRFPVHSATWRAILEAHQPSDWAQSEAAQQQSAWETRRHGHAADDDLSLFLRTVSRFMPVAAMLALVLAIGALVRLGMESIQCPTEHRHWRHIDASGERSRLVLKLLGLLAALNLIDLLFTTVGHQAGMIIELNPVGRSLLNNPLLLTVFKLAFAGAGIVVLAKLRQRRAAEVASWWLCLTYTVLMLRWVGATSLLIA